MKERKESKMTPKVHFQMPWKIAVPLRKMREESSLHALLYPQTVMPPTLGNAISHVSAPGIL